MTKLKTINIKGKKYVEVNERLKYFRSNYPNHSLLSEITHIDSEMVVVRTQIIDPEDRILASGHAHEEKSASFINKTSYVENCETSSWGRCLANFGIGIDESVASANEVDIAIKKQNIKSTTKKMTIEIYQAMMKSIKDGNKDLVVEHMNKYDMTKAQKDAITKAINETA
tara:strand:- start:3667 stop:4176 length:510 start_codon:yes stop_codon:yes gene_type:complete